MTSAELKSAGIEMFGERRYVSGLASALKVERSTIWRYCVQGVDPPGPVAAAVSCWLEQFRESGRVPGGVVQR